MKDISHLPLRSEEDARTSWCPCVNPTPHMVGWIAGRRRLPRRAQVLLIQHYNWELGAGNSQTITSSLKHETVRSADQCRVPRVTPSQGNLRPRHTHQLRPQGHLPKSTTNATHKNTRHRGVKDPSIPNTPSLAIPYTINRTLQTPKTTLCSLRSQ